MSQIDHVPHAPVEMPATSAYFAALNNLLDACEKEIEDAQSLVTYDDEPPAGSTDDSRI